MQEKGIVDFKATDRHRMAPHTGLVAVGNLKVLLTDDILSRVLDRLHYNAINSKEEGDANVLYYDTESLNNNVPNQPESRTSLPLSGGASPQPGYRGRTTLHIFIRSKHR